ncbi:hypothetical protein PIB30_045767 [Stylosanthes scabra]|uniref:Uncharacterized protein n=1 Tax=Stylosanthes scabra TaxID=79078 RepID=A0ABU6UJJ1_9FABA|nr:hypothetical protein [Stylosanthes scabra]
MEAKSLTFLERALSFSKIHYILTKSICKPVSALLLMFPIAWSTKAQNSSKVREIQSNSWVRSSEGGVFGAGEYDCGWQPID